MKKEEKDDQEEEEDEEDENKSKKRREFEAIEMKVSTISLLARTGKPRPGNEHPSRRREERT